MGVGVGVGEFRKGRRDEKKAVILAMMFLKISIVEIV